MGGGFCNYVFNKSNLKTLRIGRLSFIVDAIEDAVARSPAQEDLDLDCLSDKSDLAMASNSLSSIAIRRFDKSVVKPLCAFNFAFLLSTVRGRERDSRRRERRQGYTFTVT